MTEYRIQRIYDDPTDGDGWRVLIDRLWPRGVSKERAALDVWAKELSPSTELRHWFNHTPEKFEEFTRRYRAELESSEESLRAADELRDRQRKPPEPEKDRGHRAGARRRADRAAAAAAAHSCEGGHQRHGARRPLISLFGARRCALPFAQVVGHRVEIAF